MGSRPGAAYAAFAEDRLGILRAGTQADLTLVDRDLFRASPRDFLNSRVVMTIIAGKVVFESPWNLVISIALRDTRLAALLSLPSFLTAGLAVPGRQETRAERG